MAGRKATRIAMAAVVAVGATMMAGCVKVVGTTCTTATVTFDAPANVTGSAYAISAFPPGQSDPLTNIVGVIAAPGTVGLGTVTGLTPGAAYIARAYPVKAGHLSGGITIAGLGTPLGDSTPFTEPASC